MTEAGKMDYGDILKRAWNVTWRYKALWVLGLFVGAASYSNSRTSTTASPLSSGSTASVQSSLMQWGWLIAIAVLVGLVIGLAIAVVALAARGGLIHLVNEAEEGRPVKLGAGWRAGFSKWWRLFGVSLLVALPLLVIVLIIVAVVGVSAFSAVGAYAAGGSTRTLLTTLVGPLAGSVCLVLVLVVIAAILGVMLGIVSNLAVRYIMLQDRHVMESLKQGWNDLWSKRGAFLMFLVMLGVGIGVLIVFAIVGGILSAPALVISGTRVAGVGAPLLGLVALVMLLPAAIYGTFVEAAWTIFFRRMTGMQPVLAVAEPAPAYPMYTPPVPPAPPVYAPAPPMAPEPPAPPAPPVAPEPPAAPEPPFVPEPPVASGPDA